MDKNKKILLAVLMMLLIAIVAVEAIWIYKLGLASKKLEKTGSKVQVERYLNV